MRKIIILSILCFAASIGQAQLNYLSKGNKVIYFGISIGVNYGDFKTIRKPKIDALQTDSILSARSAFGPGFDLGIIANYQFHKSFDLRFVPALSFSDKSVVFQDVTGLETTKTVSSIYMSLPLYIRWKSKPIKDFRFFVLGGGRYNFDLNALSNGRNNEEQLLINRHDFGVEMGLGFQVYFESFILSPEIKVFHSLSNMKQPNESLIYSRAIDKLFSRIFTLSINLEG